MCIIDPTPSHLCGFCQVSYASAACTLAMRTAASALRLIGSMHTIAKLHQTDGAMRRGTTCLTARTRGAIATCPCPCTCRCQQVPHLSIPTERHVPSQAIGRTNEHSVAHVAVAGRVISGSCTSRTAAQGGRSSLQHQALQDPVATLRQCLQTYRPRADRSVS